MIILYADIRGKDHPVVTTPETITSSSAAAMIEVAMRVMLDKLAEVTGVPPLGMKMTVAWADGSVAEKEIDLSDCTNPNLN